MNGMMKLRTLVATALTGLLLSVAPVSQLAAQNDPSVTIRQVVEKWLQGRYQVDEITQTPLKSMYEVRIGTDLMYVDARGEYAFIEGQMIDLKANKNLTQARLEDLNRIDFGKDLLVRRSEAGTFPDVRGQGIHGVLGLWALRFAGRIPRIDLVCPPVDPDKERVGMRRKDDQKSEQATK